jgi:hypothetical protein
MEAETVGAEMIDIQDVGDDPISQIEQVLAVIILLEFWFIVVLVYGSLGGFT